MDALNFHFKLTERERESFTRWSDSSDENMFEEGWGWMPFTFILNLQRERERVLHVGLILQMKTCSGRGGGGCPQLSF